MGGTSKKTRSTKDPLPCHVCGHPRKFVAMRTKEGADGRVAKWPEYEKCPNTGNPKLHPRKAKDYSDRILDAEIREAARRAAKRADLPEGVLYQVLDDVDDPLSGVETCLGHFVERYGTLPKAVGVDADAFDPKESFLEIETDDGEAKIPVMQMKTLTRGYGYLYLLTGVGK